MQTTGTPLTHADRQARGRGARKQLARSAHGNFNPASCKHAPLDLLRRSMAGRLPHLIPLKYERMVASPFGFFRGAVPIMAAELSCHPNTGITTQLCGDAHVLNLGAYESPDGGLVFDINDFDETFRGPFEYDVKRLATSLILAGREAGVSHSARCDAVLHFVQQYRRMMHKFASMPVLEVVRYQIHRLVDIEPMPAIFAQAGRSTPRKLLKSLTQPADDIGSAEDDPKARIFRSEAPVLERLSAKQAAPVLAALTPYARTLQPERRHFLEQYSPRDVAFKVVGTGSVGLRDYVIYCENLSREGGTDPLFLQFKEETASAYAAYLPASLPDESPHSHQGHRVVDGQRAMQLTSDPFLGYTTIGKCDYLVRQLNDHKAALNLKKVTAESLLGYADVCGELFARGHARAGDPVTLSAYLGTSERFDQAILSFARSYADKTEKDWLALKKSREWLAIKKTQKKQ